MLCHKSSFEYNTRKILRIFVNRYGSLLFAILIASQPLFSLEDIITWEMAQTRALNESYDLSMDYTLIEEREGEQTQALLFDNPIFSYSVENVFGNKHWRGWRAAESRYEIAQPLVIGGKRCHSAKSAEYRICAAEQGYEASQFAVLNGLSKAFLVVAARQELASLADFQKQIAEEILATVSQKLEAGKISPIHRSKATLQLANTELALENAHVNLQVARENLAVFFSIVCPDFSAVFFPFFAVNCPRAFEESVHEIRMHPALLQAEYEQLASEEGLLFERSSRIPDLIVSVGVKTVQKTHETGMTFGAMFPLPFFNRNQGNIQRVTAESRRLCEQIESIELRLENRLSIAHKELTRAYDQAVRFKTSVLQLAEEAFEYAKSGYEEGKFEYLDLLDAQKALFESQERYIDILLDYHIKCADLEYLTP